jgi:hypothetical protein
VRASALKLQEKRSGASQAKSRCGPRPDPAIRLTRPSRPHGPNEHAERSTNIRLPEQAGEGILQFKTASNPIPISLPQPNTSDSPLNTDEVVEGQTEWTLVHWRRNSAMVPRCWKG